MEKYDLHTHFFTNWAKGRYSLERKPRTPKVILDAIRKARLDGVVLCSAGDEGTNKDVYEQFAEASKYKENCGGYSLTKEIGNALIFEDSEGALKVIKGQEVLTGQGHIVAIGLEKGEIIKSNLGIEKTLKEIKSVGAISDADHYKGFCGIGEINLSRYAYDGLIDVFESFNANYTHSLLSSVLGLNPINEEGEELESLLCINGISVSDCHNRRDVGNGHIEVENGSIDFSTSDNLKESLKKVLEWGEFDRVERKGNSLKSILEHSFIALYDFHIRNKLGWTDIERW